MAGLTQVVTRQVVEATQRLSDRRETPLWGGPSGLPRNPLGHPARAHAGSTFCNPRTSCGDTNGSTLHVAKQVRGIQNPQNCRQAHRKSHLSGAPFFSMAYPNSYLARFPIGHTVVTRKPLTWLLYAAEMANIRCRSGSAATAGREASTSSTMQSHGRGKKKSWLNNAGISAVSTNPAILPKYSSDILRGGDHGHNR